MSISAISYYPPWPPVTDAANTNTNQGTNSFGTTAANASAATASQPVATSSTDPFQQLSASLQAMLLQVQQNGTTASNASQTSGPVSPIQTAANTLVQDLEQSLQNASGTSPATAAATGTPVTTANSDEASAAQPHPHHHHHHMPDGNDGANSGTDTASSSSVQSAANALVADITDAMQANGTPSATTTG